MDKRFLSSWLAVFVLWMAGSFALHGAWLHADYAALPNLYRSEADSQKYFPLMLLAHVVLAGAFVWIFRQGVQNRPWAGQGVRYGVAVALLSLAPMYVIYYVVQPMPPATVVKQIVGSVLILVVLGLAVAWMHRRAE